MSGLQQLSSHYPQREFSIETLKWKLLVTSTQTADTYASLRLVHTTAILLQPVTNAMRCSKNRKIEDWV